MKYEMEELVPIVAKLAERYTSKESTSVTYEVANKLMGAVIYSIEETEKTENNSLVKKDDMSILEIYEAGVGRVKEKTKDALAMYNEIMISFSSYDNECLYDTVVKGMPEFFKWYDYKFEPQNTILTLDYPVFVNNMERTGIDKIYEYLTCIKLEQKFLGRFPKEYVTEALKEYNAGYKKMIDNICEVVLKKILLNYISEKEIRDSNPEQLRKKLKKIIDIMVINYYEDDDRLREYLYQAVNDISVRIKVTTESLHK